jgi:Ni/Co efflux regulator RcnB
MESGIMKKLTLFTFAAAALFATAGAASAQNYPGSDYGPRIEPRHDRDNDEPRSYRRDRDDDRDYGRRNYRTWNGCPPNYTVQDGVCKPYTGR